MHAPEGKILVEGFLMMLSIFPRWIERRSGAYPMMKQNTLNPWVLKNYLVSRVIASGSGPESS